MSERKSATKKKNHNRPTADKRGLYSGMQRSYYRPKVKPPELTGKLF